MLEQAVQNVKTRLEECVAQEGKLLIDIIFPNNLTTFLNKISIVTQNFRTYSNPISSKLTI